MPGGGDVDGLQAESTGDRRLRLRSAPEKGVLVDADEEARTCSRSRGRSRAQKRSNRKGKEAAPKAGRAKRHTCFFGTTGLEIKRLSPRSSAGASLPAVALRTRFRMTLRRSGAMGAAR